MSEWRLRRGWDSPGLCSLYLNTAKSSKERKDHRGGCIPLHSQSWGRGTPGTRVRGQLKRSGEGLRLSGPCKARERYVGEVAGTQRSAPGRASRKVWNTHTKSRLGSSSRFHFAAPSHNPIPFELDGYWGCHRHQGCDGPSSALRLGQASRVSSSAGSYLYLPQAECRVSLLPSPGVLMGRSDAPLCKVLPFPFPPPPSSFKFINLFIWRNGESSNGERAEREKERIPSRAQFGARTHKL